MNNTFHQAGFTPPTERPLGNERRTIVTAEIVAAVALAICTALAAIVVSIGIAEANPAGAVIDNEANLFAIALLLGLLFIGMGGFTAILPTRKHKR
ncbi:MAG TPA: hypothetical protein VHD14_11750 [Pseudolabrys sp.]|jgi:hypothetical protein|nr:hypothetical protein [Pseudolabrys sp.]